MKRWFHPGFETDLIAAAQRIGQQRTGYDRQFLDETEQAIETIMLENGAEVRFVQAMLGHACLQTTQIYTHVSIKALQEVHARTHPARLTPELQAELDAEAAEDAEG